MVKEMTLKSEEIGEKYSSCGHTKRNLAHHDYAEAWGIEACGFLDPPKMLIGLGSLP